jgi:dinuclear metal center YbgI/SA1388 family protein
MAGIEAFTMVEPSRQSPLVTVAHVVAFLDRFAPPDLAADWDNVGLLLGDQAAPVQRLMTCLTVTPEVAAEAVDDGVQCIVTHHPVLFRSVKRLTAATSEGRMLLALIRAGVAVYSPHSAFDNTHGGINDALARRLGLIEVGPLRRRQGSGQCKVVVFVPEADLTRVSEAMFEAGAGHIGQYSQCSFRLAGTGTFFGSEATNPTVGQKGRREEVSEWRLEVICPEEDIERVLAAMRRAHSYEEPAYDVYPLRPKASPLGEGRLGRLSQPTALKSLAQLVKTQLNAHLVQLVGDPARPVERIAIVCGAGNEFLTDALEVGAEVLLTGEVSFHDCLRAQASGLALLLPGHYASERCGVEDLAGRLQAQWPDLKVWASRRERDPVQSYAGTV